jgi:FkbM family methyltransferase
MKIELIIKYFFDNKPANVVQIGSNDGKTGDPLHDLIKLNNWIVTFVEPVPYLFEKLVQNYGTQPRFKFIQKAIGEGKSNFYFIDKQAGLDLNLPVWYDQLGSFNPNHIIKHFGESIKPYMRYIEINTINLNELFYDNIDLLHIDVEGYDWNVLKQLDQTKYSPKVILFEHKHLSDSDYQLCKEFLNRYELIRLEEDTICLNKGYEDVNLYLQYNQIYLYSINK